MLNYQRVPLDDSMMDDIERFVCSSAATARKNRHTCRRDSGYRMYAAPSPQSLRVNPNGDKLEWVKTPTVGTKNGVSVSIYQLAVPPSVSPLSEKNGGFP